MDTLNAHFDFHVGKQYHGDIPVDLYFALEHLHYMDGWWKPFDTWAPTGNKKVRQEMRELVKLGYAKRTGMFNEVTGLIAGSGYFITKAGQEKFEQLKKEWK